jgi:hypothetical protein
VELDLDLPDLGKIQLSRIDLESFLRIGERVISTYALETGISRLLPGLDTPEEGFERQVHTLMDILENLGKDLFKLRFVFFPFRKQVICFVLAQRLTFVLPGGLADFQSFVICPSA